MQIAKIFCFKKILKDQAQKNSDMNDESNPAIFIQKEVIKEYISKYSDEDLLRIMSEKITHMDYNNLQEIIFSKQK